MRILIIGDLSSIWLEKLLSRLIPLTNHSFFILDVFRGQFIPAGRLNEAMPIPLPQKGIQKKIFHTLAALKSIMILLFHPKYDIIHIHFANPLLYYFLSLFRLKSCRIMVSLYGSDFYKLSPKQYRHQAAIYRHAEEITFTSHQMGADFLKQFNALHHKITICRFGLSILEEIERVKAAHVQVKTRMGLPDNRIILCIGHSANIREQHVEIITRLKKLPDSIKDRMFAILPFTYNSFTSLFEKVDHSMKSSGIQYKILTDRLSDHDVAAMRLSSDIMLNLPSTDQMTAAMLETLYAGGMVITGTWLPYDKLDAAQVSYIKIQEMDELPGILEEVFNQLSMKKPVVDGFHNKEVIGALFDWKDCIQDWVQLYSKTN